MNDDRASFIAPYLPPPMSQGSEQGIRIVDAPKPGTTEVPPLPPAPTGPETETQVFLRRANVPDRRTFNMQRFADVFSERLLEPVLEHGFKYEATPPARASDPLSPKSQLRIAADGIKSALANLNAMGDVVHPAFVPTRITGLEAQVHAHAMEGHRLLVLIGPSEQRLASFEILHPKKGK